MDQHVTWLTLDSDDNHPTRFLSYLIASLRKFHPELGECAWSLLQSIRSHRTLRQCSP